MPLSREGGGARLFSEVTPERLEILDRLRRVGRCRADGLAGQLPGPRDSAELAADIERLETLGLLERAQDQMLSVPFESIETRYRRTDVLLTTVTSLLLHAAHERPP